MEVNKGVIQEGTQQRGQHREVAAKAWDAARRENEEEGMAAMGKGLQPVILRSEKEKTSKLSELISNCKKVRK